MTKSHSDERIFISLFKVLGFEYKNYIGARISVQSSATWYIATRDPNQVLYFASISTDLAHQRLGMGAWASGVAFVALLLIHINGWL